MGRNGEEKRAIFIGPTLISMGNIIKDGKNMYFKKVPSKPFFDKWSIVMGNVDDVYKEVRKLYVPSKGETDMEVEIYWCDLQLKDYSPQIHPTHLAELNSLKTENAMLKLKVNRIINMVYDSENADLNKKKLKDEIEYINKIKSPFLGQEGGGMGGSPFMGSPFNRFGGP